MYIYIHILCINITSNKYSSERRHVESNICEKVTAPFTLDARDNLVIIFFVSCESNNNRVFEVLSLKNL